jgi:tRNA-2-methylthio-N6-dimethylallyladenosine synthase
VLIGVGGCVASQEGAAIVERAPYVDLVFGPQTLHRLPQMIARARAPAAAAGRHQLSRDREVRPPAAARVDGAAPSSRSWKAAASTAASASCPTRAARKCRARSTTCWPRSPAWPQGVKEVTLLGQNVNAYRGAMGTGDIADFALLLEYVAEIPASSASATPPRIRTSSRERLIEAYAACRKLVSHLHLPVQQRQRPHPGAMKRGYTALEYKSTSASCARCGPDIASPPTSSSAFPARPSATSRRR